MSNEKSFSWRRLAKEINSIVFSGGVITEVGLDAEIKYAIAQTNHAGDVYHTTPMIAELQLSMDNINYYYTHRENK